MQFDAPIICGQAPPPHPIPRRLTPPAPPDENRRRPSAPSTPANPFQYQVSTLDIIMPEEWKNQPDPLFYISARYRARHRADGPPPRPSRISGCTATGRAAPSMNSPAAPSPSSLPRQAPQPPLDDRRRNWPRIEDWSARDAREVAAKPPKPPNVPLGALVPIGEESGNLPHHATPTPPSVVEWCSGGAAGRVGGSRNVRRSIGRPTGRTCACSSSTTIRTSANRSTPRCRPRAR